MMKNVKLDIAKTGIEISADIEAKAQAANALLHSGKGAGNDFLGWVRLPSSISENEIDAIQKEAAKLRSKADVVVCIGIGGSYLGAKAVLEAMSDPFKLLHKEQKDPTVIFAGQNISEDYTAELLAALKEHSIAAIVISKSGTTTEPAIAFRLIKAEIEKRYGKKEAAERIVAITDKARGALKTLATQEGYPTFVIPDDVGGRFSVLTPVGLLPLAVAGVDIAVLVRGAQEMEKATAEGVAFKENPAAVYAAVRNILYDGGKKIEILGSYEPKLQYINEWWKQLYGESEGKQGKGIFPASVTLTADLHSMGQYIQDGERTLFETIISVAKPAAEVLIEADGLSAFGRIQDFDLQIHRGEVVGFAGLLGSGRTETAELLAGVAKPEQGALRMNGREVHFNSPLDAMHHKIAFCPEDRKIQGIIGDLSVRENIIIGLQAKKGMWNHIPLKEQERIADEYIKLLQIKVSSPEQLIRNLSGGNQQKVVIAKTLAAKSSIIIFDEPTRGIDVSAKQEIYKLMNELVATGHSIIMVSSDMPELLGMSDRIVVIAEGCKNGEVEKADFDQNYILDLASGGKVKGAC